jgi:hypothetical protein
MSANLAQARAARDKVKSLLRGRRISGGVGVERTPDGYGVKVSLAAPSDEDEVPDEVDGVSVSTRFGGQAHAY